MRIAVILNGIPSKAKRFHRLVAPLFPAQLKYTLLTTTASGHAEALADQAVRDGFEVILSAGGDGTLHEVVNGVLRGREVGLPLPRIGIIPLGNGNDLARMLDCMDTGSLLQGLASATPRAVDAGKITCMSDSGATRVRYFINVADVGAGPDVVGLVERFGKLKRSRFAYYVGVVVSLIRYSLVRLTAETEQWKWSGKARSFAVANGRSHGHGLYVAPDARLDDGLLNCFIAGKVSVLTFVRVTPALTGGRKILHPEVHYRVARRIALSSERKSPLQADGEMTGYLPAVFEVLPERLHFVV